jgi:hypothetical protein
VTFEERWSVPSRDYGIEFVSGDTLIDQSYPESRVRALDGSTGRVLWSAPTYGWVSPWRGGVFVNSEDPTEYTLHRLSGAAPSPTTAIRRSTITRWTTGTSS